MRQLRKGKGGVEGGKSEGIEELTITSARLA